MEGIHRSEQPPVCHGDERDENRAAVAEVVALGGGWVARLFALVRERDDDHDLPVREIAAYGMALPDGRVMTAWPSGSGVCMWRSPESASRRLGSELVWLG